MTISYKESKKNFKLTDFNKGELKSMDLTKKYPDIIEVCRKHDCGYSEAIKIIESEKE